MVVGQPGNVLVQGPPAPASERKGFLPTPALWSGIDLRTFFCSVNLGSNLVVSAAFDDVWKIHSEEANVVPTKHSDPCKSFLVFLFPLIVFSSLGFFNWRIQINQQPEQMPNNQSQAFSVFETNRPPSQDIMPNRIRLHFLSQRISVSTSAKCTVSRREDLIVIQVKAASSFRDSDCQPHTDCSGATQTSSFHWGKLSSPHSFYFCNPDRAVSLVSFHAK